MRRCWPVLVAAALVLGTGAGARTAQTPARTAPPPPRPFAVVEQDLGDLRRALTSGDVTSRDLVELYRRRIDAYDRQGPQLRAFISLDPSALDQAQQRDEERRQGRIRGPLHGIPLAIKDNFLTAGLATTAGTLALSDFVSSVDAFQVRRLREQGAIVLGKTNLHELAAGITTVSSAGGQTRNPYDPTRNPGGSSGGTAAAVAASLAPAGLGTDTCGSIRIPAAQNNLWGLRPTVGLSSRAGIVPLAHSQDVAGPIARSVTDLALLLDATAGADPDDPVTADNEARPPSSYLGFMGDSSLAGVRIGVVTSLMGADAADAAVRHVASIALDTLGDMGADVNDIELAGLDAQLRETSTIALEFSDDLQGFLTAFRAPVRSLDEILRSGLYRAELDVILRRWNRVGTPDPEAYARVQGRRQVVKQQVLDAMAAGGLTFLAYPTIRRTAAAIGTPQDGNNCQLSATTGMPAISMPAGFAADGMPVGLELLGRPFSEGALLRVAYAYERFAQPRRPPTTAPELPLPR